MWRPILSKIATYEEISTYWDIDDLRECWVAMDLKDKAEELQNKKAQAKK